MIASQTGPADVPLLTADAVTDEHVSEAWKTGRLTGRELMHARGHEIGPCFNKPTPDEVRVARARVAEILNGRTVILREGSPGSGRFA